MRAVERLFWIRLDFDNSWRAHAASVRAARLLRSLPPDVAPLLASALSMAKGFEPGFDSAFALESLFEEIDYLRDQDYLPLRKNCLLGVCAAFEEFSKTYAAALSYEPNWQQMTESQGRLTQDTSADFEQRYLAEDRSWRRGYGKFLLEKFPWVDPLKVKAVEDVFWLRNQVAHNADRANVEKSLTICEHSFHQGDKVSIDGRLLGICVEGLRSAVSSISDPTPYMETVI